MKYKSPVRLTKLLPLLLLAVVVVFSGRPIYVAADAFDDQINALHAANDEKQATANQLQTQADSYQGAINALQGQINVLQGSINANTAKQTDVQNKIVEAEAELAKQKKNLGDNIRQMYLEGEISTIEMLASSKDLSEFIDKQQYRNSVQSKIQDTLTKITELKHQLNGQKEEVEKLLKDQRTMQSALAGQRSQQDTLLAFTQGQKDQYTAAIRANNAAISSLRAQQIAANARFIGSAGTGPACGGGYPAKWCEVPQDSVLDSWGMYNRECVSYTAFKVAASGRHMPAWGFKGRGDAKMWDDEARAAGIPVDTIPRAGDVAISNSGNWGHAMYVESVNGDGTINISQYNAAFDGRYSTRSNLPVGNLVFIHF